MIYIVFLFCCKSIFNARRFQIFRFMDLYVYAALMHVEKQGTNFPKKIDYVLVTKYLFFSSMILSFVKTEVTTDTVKGFK